MKRILYWFEDSNRWKHVLGGIIIGIISDDWYCASLTGLGTASSLEYKDKSHGGSWDWIDWSFTIGGVAVGFGFRSFLTKFCSGIFA